MTVRVQSILQILGGRWCAGDTMALGDFVRLVTARSTYVRLVAAFCYWNNAASGTELRVPVISDQKQARSATELSSIYHPVKLQVSSARRGWL